MGLFSFSFDLITWYTGEAAIIQLPNSAVVKVGVTIQVVVTIAVACDCTIQDFPECPVVKVDIGVR